jgi:hypothetical protein
VSLIVNNEEYLIRALPDTGASSSSSNISIIIIIIIEAYTSEMFPFIKTDDSNFC